MKVHEKTPPERVSGFENVFLLETAVIDESSAARPLAASQEEENVPQESSGAGPSNAVEQDASIARLAGSFSSPHPVRAEQTHNRMDRPSWQTRLIELEQQAWKEKKELARKQSDAPLVLTTVEGKEDYQTLLQRRDQQSRKRLLDACKEQEDLERAPSDLPISRQTGLPKSPPPLNPKRSFTQADEGDYQKNLQQPPQQNKKRFMMAHKEQEELVRNLSDSSTSPTTVDDGDYYQTLLHQLDEQNKKRLLAARKELDNSTRAPSDLPIPRQTGLPRSPPPLNPKRTSTQDENDYQNELQQLPQQNLRRLMMAGKEQEDAERAPSNPTTSRQIELSSGDSYQEQLQLLEQRDNEGLMAPRKEQGQENLAKETSDGPTTLTSPKTFQQYQKHPITNRSLRQLLSEPQNKNRALTGDIEKEFLEHKLSGRLVMTNEDREQYQATLKMIEEHNKRRLIAAREAQDQDYTQSIAEGPVSPTTDLSTLTALCTASESQITLAQYMHDKHRLAVSKGQNQMEQM